MKNLFDLQNRVAIITGGAGLLGVKHAEAIAEIGGIPIMIDINEKKVKSEAQIIRDTYNVGAIGIKCDITKTEEVKNILCKIINDFGQLDILINNAAIDPKVETKGTQNNSSRLEKFIANNWDKEFEVGVTGVFICTHIFGSYMAECEKGVIINIGSDLSFIAPDQSIYHQNEDYFDRPVKPFSYSVIKHSLLGLSKYFAILWASKGVRVKVLAPGGVWNNKLSDEFVDKITQKIPIRKMAGINDYKGSIQFLCSDASSYMTGANLLVDGGRTTGFF